MHVADALLAQPVGVGDEDELLVGRHAGLLDADDRRVLVLALQLDALEFQNAPSVASTFLDSIAGTRLKPTLTSLDRRRVDAGFASRSSCS